MPGKPKTLRIAWWSLAATGALIATGIVVFIFKFNANAVAAPGVILVPTGATYGQLLDSLGRDGEHLRDMAAFRSAAKITDLETSVRPGRYLLKEGMSYRSVVHMFRRGLQTPVRLTFNNIRTIDRLAGALSRQVEPDSLTLLAAFTDPRFTENYGFEPDTFLAMFIPNTYEVYWNTPVEALCDRMQKEYAKFWNGERSEKAARVGLSPLEVSVLASIVYEETKKGDEMPRVAGVYINRLRIGMALQADPTLKFAAGDFSLRRVLALHKQIDSPYNTYMYPGLPPGPICMPSIRAIDAVLDYERHNYLYFCAAPDFSGYHRFAANLAGHERNRQAYIRFLNENGIR